MKIAVVGAGVSGLAAAWSLNEHSEHEVHLFEADSRFGGHANTASFTRPGNKGANAVDVDTGFIVFNPSTYPNFLRFLSLYPELEAAIQPTEMTFSVSRDDGQFEWAGKTLGSVFCQPQRLFDRNMWRMLYDILRFNACATMLLLEPERKQDLSIGEYLEREGYSAAFRDDYLIPMTAAVWSTPPDKCALGFPARTLIQFMYNHHLLQIIGKPSWLTLRGGSRIYVDHIISLIPSPQLHLNTPVRAVSTTLALGPDQHQVELQTESGDTHTFDHVIFACHADTTLKSLRAGKGLTEEEERILSAFQFSGNEAILHADIRLMPKKRVAWSCWNYLTYSEIDTATGRKKANVDKVALTYCMNDLQHISEAEHGSVLVTLNPPFDPRAEEVVARYKYEHPVIDVEAVRAQDLLPSIQNIRGISYAGAWTKYGFHEDGFTSGLRAALSLQGM
ncbi:hypothetical protein PHLGIDRAFT_73035 [Phlebiopsis gigantea 11061_1 CR5-6]|uniref:Amine oxidase domain-containing protein n=1 Tax=Phlebiopsis gigantea (strain 11061_1 CR5-6) TaxID=745531 RepID=A0A0C3RWY2_PHLG1|nr:hypothetical protein PHLGIDRAFT_73035 [Phlebiopsis gigantea 11061_1 CR5-6]